VVKSYCRREAHNGVHQGELAGMIEPQSRNAFPCGTKGRFGEPLQLAAIDEGLEEILLQVEIIVIDHRQGIPERR
jgi:hypothetical protein